MAVTQADIDALEKAIVSGVRMVRWPDGSSTEYRDMNEMRQALAMARAALAPASVTVPRILQVRY